MNTERYEDAVYDFAEELVEEIVTACEEMQVAEVAEFVKNYENGDEVAEKVWNENELQIRHLIAYNYINNFEYSLAEKMENIFDKHIDDLRGA